LHDINRIKVSNNRIHEVINRILENEYDPSTHDITQVPDHSGIYFICIKSNANIPDSLNQLINKFIVQISECKNNQRLIYIGIAGARNPRTASLRRRDCHDHFYGNNAGISTLRKSLGTLFGYTLVPRSNNPSDKKTKFSLSDEILLTKWMSESLLMYYKECNNPNEYEDILIEYFNPPLNIRGNKCLINKAFREWLEKARSKKTMEERQALAVNLI
jgi:hypothetical protein